jgi:hypothetical protein
MTLVFHPHADSHVEYEDQIERFLADTDPGVVYLCFDSRECYERESLLRSYQCMYGQATRR